jgi:hypothetical protein
VPPTNKEFCASSIWRVKTAPLDSTRPRWQLPDVSDDWRARALAAVRALQPEVDAITTEKRAAAAVENTISRHAAELTSEAVAEMFED